jgi:hypothetical protein
METIEKKRARQRTPEYKEKKLEVLEIVFKQLEQEEVDKELDDFGRLRYKNNKGKREWFMAKKE